MGEKYTKEYTIGYFGTDSDFALTASSLSLYFQDLAIYHSDAVGYTLDYLSEENKGWAITNWHIKVFRYPKFGETITIGTWANKCRRMQAERSFDVKDQFGNIICIAMSRWIFIDLLKRRPSKLLEGMEDAYVCDVPSSIENEKYIMPKSEDEVFFGERNFVVTRRDTDTNGHTNNTKYIEWAIDDVPDDIYENYVSEDIRVVYRKECYKGSKVTSKCYINEIGDKKEIISFFVNTDDQKVIFSEVSTIWRKK